MINIHLISDIYSTINKVDYKAPIGTDLIILAGDIASGDKGLIWARQTFYTHPIIYIAGNHEYYWHDLSDIETMRKTAQELDIVFLDNDEFTLNEVKFLGTTLWTDFNKFSLKDVNSEWQTHNDYKQISSKEWWGKTDNRNEALKLMKPISGFHFEADFFSPTVAYLLHQKSVQWLWKKLAEPYKGKTVIISHHIPSHQGFSIKYGKYKDYSRCSDLDILIKTNSIDLWLHGHSHESLDYKIGNTRIISNTNSVISNNFNPDLLIKI